MGFWPVVNNVLRKADIILIILDARMPELSRNKEIEEKIYRSGKKFVLVFNKIDLIGEKEKKELRENYGDGFFVSGVKNIGISNLKREMQIMAKRLHLGEDFWIGVVGYPNVGKSSVINALAKRASAKTGKFAGTTKGSQWVRAGGLKVIDSPGVIPFDEKGVRLGLLGARDPEKLRVPEQATDKLIKLFVEKGKLKNLSDFYKVNLISEDSYEILLSIGQKRGFLMKGGIVDERKTAIKILRDWQQGKLRL